MGLGAPGEGLDEIISRVSSTLNSSMIPCVSITAHPDPPYQQPLVGAKASWQTASRRAPAGSAAWHPQLPRHHLPYGPQTWFSATLWSTQTEAELTTAGDRPLVSSQIRYSLAHTTAAEASWNLSSTGLLSLLPTETSWTSTRTSTG